MEGAKKYPLVSVYLPTLNREALLERAVDSVLKQTYANFELLIVDDGSTDGTLAYLDLLVRRDSRVKVFHKMNFDKKKGAPASRNIAIQNSVGKFVTGLDDDDYFDENRLEVFVKKYRDNYSCLSSNFFINDGVGTFKMFLIRRTVGYKDLFDSNCLGPQVFVERQRIINVGMFDEELKSSQDVDLWIRLILKYGKALRLRCATYYVDVSHDQQRITTSPSRKVGMRQFVEKHKNIMTSGQVKYRLDKVSGNSGRKISKLVFAKRYGVRVFIKSIKSRLKLN